MLDAFQGGAGPDSKIGQPLRPDGDIRGAEIRLDSLHKNYGGVAAVDGVDLRLSAGEFVSLLGPSGSGKTTTLMMIAGFEVPDHGRIHIDGRSVADVPAYKRDIGMVFQSYALFPHMTVQDNIAYPLEMRKMKRTDIRRQVARALELVRLPAADYAGRYPRQLSGGQQQRVALARALTYEPRVLLMDEPLGALDKKLREQMQLEIKRIHEETRTTVIYVTHDQEEALVMSDRIAVFNAGRIEQLGSPAELYERPSSRFVADFIGESNLFEGSIEEVATSICVVRHGDWRMRLQSREPVQRGQAVGIAVRPEKISIAPAGGADITAAGERSLAYGIIESVIYVGETTRYIVRLATGAQAIVKQQNRHGREQLSSGQNVRISWSSEDGVLLLR